MHGVRELVQPSTTQLVTRKQNTAKKRLLLIGQHHVTPTGTWSCLSRRSTWTAWVFLCLIFFFLFFFNFTTGYCVTLYKDVWRRASVRSSGGEWMLGIGRLGCDPRAAPQLPVGLQPRWVQPAWQAELTASAWVCSPQSASINIYAVFRSGASMLNRRLPSVRAPTVLLVF